MIRKSSVLWVLLAVCCLSLVAGCSKPGEGARKPAPAPAPTKDISGS